MAREFEDSRYRYLHISCHGNEEGFRLTYDRISFTEFATTFRGLLHRRRVFLSACSVAQPELAKELFDSYEGAPYSVVGPREEIDFSTAAVTWASLYNLLFREGAASVQGENIRKHLTALAKLNGTTFVYFGRKKAKPYFAESKLPASPTSRV